VPDPDPDPHPIAQSTRISRPDDQVQWSGRYLPSLVSRTLQLTRTIVVGRRTRSETRAGQLIGFLCIYSLYAKAKQEDTRCIASKQATQLEQQYQVRHISTLSQPSTSKHTVRTLYHNNPTAQQRRTIFPANHISSLSVSQSPRPKQQLQPPHAKPSRRTAVMC